MFVIWRFAWVLVTYTEYSGTICKIPEFYIIEGEDNHGDENHWRMHLLRSVHSRVPNRIDLRGRYDLCDQCWYLRWVCRTFRYPAVPVGLPRRLHCESLGFFHSFSRNACVRSYGYRHFLFNSGGMIHKSTANFEYNPQFRYFWYTIYTP